MASETAEGNLRSAGSSSRSLRAMLPILYYKVILIKVHFRGAIRTSHTFLGEDGGIILVVLGRGVPQAQNQESLC